MKTEIGKNDWDQTFGVASKNIGNPEGSFAKNSVHIGDHLTLLHAKGLVPPSLEKLCDEIIKFGSRD